jgi:hypothetical protein
LTPDRAGRPTRKPAARRASAGEPHTAPGPNDTYEIAYFKRHKVDDPRESVPGSEFLASCPAQLRAKLWAVLVTVAAAPPPRFSGGGFWEAMHGKMTGFHEVRVDGPGRRHYRLFCKLDTTAQGRGPLLTVLWGATKAFRTELSDADYDRVLAFGREYLSRNPRSLA